MGSDFLGTTIGDAKKREVYGLKVSEMKKSADSDLFPLLHLCVQVLNKLTQNVIPELISLLYPLPQHDHIYFSKFKEAFSNILKNEKGTQGSTDIEIMIQSPHHSQSPIKKSVHHLAKGECTLSANPPRPTPLPPPVPYPIEGSNSTIATITTTTQTFHNNQQRSPPPSLALDMNQLSQQLPDLPLLDSLQCTTSKAYPFSHLSPPSLSSLPFINSPQQLKMFLIRSFCQQTLEKLSTYEMYACARMSLCLDRGLDGADVHSSETTQKMKQQQQQQQQEEGSTLIADNNQDAIKILQVRLIQLRQLLRIHQEAFQLSKQQHMHSITQQLPLFLSFLSVTLPSEARNIPDHSLNPIYPNKSEQVIHQFLQSRLEQYTEVFLSKWIFSFIEDGKEIGKKMALVGGIHYEFQFSFSFLFHLPLKLIRVVFNGLYKSLFYTVSSVHKAGRIYFNPIQFKSDVATHFLSSLLSPQSSFSVSLVSQLSQVLDSLILESTISIQSDIKTLQDTMYLFSHNTTTTNSNNNNLEHNINTSQNVLKVEEDVKLSNLMQTIGSSQKILEGVLLDLNKLIL